VYLNIIITTVLTKDHTSYKLRMKLKEYSRSYINMKLGMFIKIYKTTFIYTEMAVVRLSSQELKASAHRSQVIIHQ